MHSSCRLELYCVCCTLCMPSCAVEARTPELVGRAVVFSVLGAIIFSFNERSVFKAGPEKNLKVIKTGAREATQLVKCLPRRREGPSLVPGTHIRIQLRWCPSVNSALRSGDVRAAAFTGQPIWLCRWGPGSVRDPVLFMNIPNSDSGLHTQPSPYEHIQHTH